MRNPNYTKIFFWSSILLMLLSVFSIRSCIKNQRIIKEAKGNAGSASSDTVTQHWIDRWKTEHAEKQAIQGTLRSVELTNAAQLDEASARVQIQRRQIDGLQKVVADLKGRFSSAVIHDTVRDVLYFKYADSNSTFAGEIKHDTVVVDYDIEVPIFLTQYWKRKWLLGKKTHYVDGYSTNTHAHITNLSSIRINKTEPGRFGIGPYIGIGYNGSGITPSIGIALNFSMFRF